MKFGFYTPNFDYCGDPRLLVELAHEAEEARWDGFFIWDHLQYREPAADPWVALAAMAMRTRRIRLGPLVTPVPRRHIAKLAREVVTLDHVSGGRLIFGVGAGWEAFPEYRAFGDETDPKARAAMLDEGLSVLRALWSGSPVSHRGVHYQVECEAFQQALQQPRVPVWVAATWPAKKPLRRAAQWDGVFPISPKGAGGLETALDEIRGIAAFVREQRPGGAAYDIVKIGRTRDAHDTAGVATFAAAGATWWMEYVFPWETPLEALRERLHEGPPRS
jgi:alkanesulfonate monooxygenase SsuD/methylene tetrahydromethanopterin reductase-like flavin-dependent oxidoreductase (luciferase family)